MLKKRPGLGAISDSPALAHAFIGFLFLALAMILVLKGLTPVHDAIGWYGAYHYFYNSLARGVLPLWNPYSQTGAPFYPYYQLFGLMEPWNYVFVLGQKITDCSTLTTYLCHYLFCDFLFIAGTYNCLRIVTKSNSISLLFSMILLLGTFPSFMHQNGALIAFYLVPFITYFFMRFLEETEPDKKGFLFFFAVALCAISSLTYVPSGMVFYVLLFVVLAFALGIAKKKELWRFAASPRGLLWIGGSVLTALLIASPVLALFYDTKVDNELFPYARVQLSTTHNLPRMFPSDLGPDLFHKGVVLPVSITWGNLVGLVLEPWPVIPGMTLKPSEIIMYVSILPLLCVLVVARRVREIGNKYARLLLAMATVTLLIMSNFRTWCSDPMSVFQRVLVSVIPTLNKVEVFENFGAVFLFCLTIASAVGFKRMVDEEKRGVWIMALVILTVKYLWAFPVWVFKPEMLATIRWWVQRPALTNRCLINLYSGFIAVLSVLLAKSLGRMPVKKLRAVSIGLLLLDLAFFIAVHVREGVVVEREFYAVLRQGGVLKAKSEASFINYREPFVKDRYGLYTFFGPEILSLKKVALPRLMNRYFGSGISLVDTVFSTQSYYDYLVNVRLDKQLATSSITYPILNFYPLKNALWVADKHEAVQRINAEDAKALGRYIFLEKATGQPPAPAAARDYARIFSAANYLNPSRQELDALGRWQARRSPGQRDFKVDVTGFGPNSLSARVESHEDGYFYFGDGYSKHWKAFLDGHETKIEKTNVNFKSIYLPKGRHDVAFIYDPTWIRYAAYASLAGSLLAVLLAGLCLVNNRTWLLA